MYTSLIKREQFAVSLRKDKKAKILAAKRKALYSDNSSTIQDLERNLA